MKKIKDYAFVHFEERDQAVEAMRALDCQEWGGAKMEISLAKPPSDKKKKEDMLRKREQRMMQAMAKSMTRTESMEFSSGPRGGWGGGHGGKMG